MPSDIYFTERGVMADAFALPLRARRAHYASGEVTLPALRLTRAGRDISNTLHYAHFRHFTPTMPLFSIFRIITDLPR